ncbi:MAG TPA: HAMP domain-containing sensor histidine kinase [Bacteroidota bacterium]
MLKEIREFGRKKKLATLLVLFVLLPAVFFSVYEFSTLNRSEALIAQVYRQQLDVVLFSLNQYAWDVANSWANALNDVLNRGPIPTSGYPAAFTPFLNENAGIRCLVITDSLLTSSHIFYPRVQIDKGDDPAIEEVEGALKRQSDVIDRLFRLQVSGYRKIEPMFIEEKTGEKTLALVFIAGGKLERRQVVAIVLDARRFIREGLSHKMNEAAGDNFLLSVSRKNSGQIVYATGEIGQGEARQTKNLWLFPDYLIGIRLKGETIEDVVHARFRSNLLLLGLLNVVLFGGLWVLYRTVRREVELAQMKSDFVSNVTHEIKTPLALIRMFAETLLLKRVRTESKKQEYYETIVQETERLTRLINNILNFSRMEAGRKEYRFASVDLNGVVRSVLKSYQIHLENEGFTVLTDLNHEPIPIHGDGEALAEALLNLIDNSVKFSREKKFLRIKTGFEKDEVYVEVEDRGVGIDPKQQKKVFEKFYRVSSGLVHTTKGSGLGLSLVKHIVDAHKGTISIRSEPGNGSTFRISIPKGHP